MKSIQYAHFYGSDPVMASYLWNEGRSFLKEGRKEGRVLLKKWE